jgi:hypothetical protein
MSDYLAEVVMPTPDLAPPPTEDPPDDEPIEDSVEEESEDELLPLHPVPVIKEKILKEEIFTSPPEPKIQAIKEKEMTDEEILKLANLPKPKQTRKKRKPMTEEQKERQREILKKANAARSLKAKERREQKEKDKELNRMVTAVKNKRMSKLKKQLESDSVEDEVPKPTVIEKEKIVEVGFSKQQLDEAVARAVEESVGKVETLRKQRKEVKKKQKAKDDHDAQVFRSINKAIKEPDVWGDCFR